MFGTPVESPRPLLRGGEFEEVCIMHAESHWPLFVRSTPGTGKTSKAKGLADNPAVRAALGYSSTEHLPVALIPAQQAEMEAICGFPVARRGEAGAPTQVDWARPTFYSDCPMILIIDEVNRAKEATRSALFPLLTHDEMINGFKLHPASLIILLGNDASHHAGARELDQALKGRVSHYDWVPDVEDWLTNWARPRMSEGVFAAEVIRYIETFPSALCVFDPNSKSDGQPDPRRWNAVARALSRQGSFDLKVKFIQSTIGKAEGDKFVEFYKNQVCLPSRELLAQAPETIAVPESLEDADRMSRYLVDVFNSRKSDCPNGDALAFGAATVLTKMAAGGFVEPAARVIREALQNVAVAKGDCLVLSPKVGPLLQASPELMQFVAHLGRIETK